MSILSGKLVQSPSSNDEECTSKAPDYRWENEKLLLKAIKGQLKITDEDMQSPSIVKAKIRDAKIDIVLE